MAPGKSGLHARGEGVEKILEEIIVENFPKMGKEILTQVQETQRVPNRINPRRNTPRHMVIKLTHFSLVPMTVDPRLITRVKVAMALSCSASFSGAGFEL